ncbi:hypothetical protein [Mesorhizobium sp. B2-3-5]|uniref:hypothetical protein n=1 Tax=Mesorhizobium sp. B2-3-5 TaxID=2589958 RepID=UPI0015E28ABD|nr:hypothetical protein [Mesorhizobium sp. B2-3-5]
MQVRETMTRDVRIANPGETLQQAAQVMAELDAGVLPVGENNRDRVMLDVADFTRARRHMVETQLKWRGVRDPAALMATHRHFSNGCRARKEKCNARQEDHREGAKGQAPRQVAEHPGWRIRS